MTNLELAQKIFESDAYAFVLVHHGQVLATGTRDGIGELLDAVAQHDKALRGASLADKVVGKAVAMVAAYAGIADVYTPLGSDAAAAVLRAHNIPFIAARTVPLIQNKRNDGACPMERLTMPLTEPHEAVAALQNFVAQKRQPVAAG